VPRSSRRRKEAVSENEPRRKCSALLGSKADHHRSRRDYIYGLYTNTTIRAHNYSTNPIRWCTYGEPGGGGGGDVCRVRATGQQATASTPDYMVLNEVVVG
jgi:hypothetical protein